MSVNLALDNAFFWIIISIIVGISYTTFLYFKNNAPWGKMTNLLFSTLRGITVALIFFLFSGALIKTISNYFQKPLVILAQDNSKSVGRVFTEKKNTQALKKLNEQLISAKKKLEEKGMEVKYADINGMLSDSIFTEYKHNITNIDQMLTNIYEKTEHLGLSAIGLISDGIYNEGGNPEFMNFIRPVFSLALGDTIPKPDVILSNVIHNKVAFKGNKFPMKVQIQSYYFDQEEIELSVTKNKIKLFSKKILLSKTNPFIEETIELEAKNVGYQRYEVAVSPLKKEYLKSNNHQNVFIDIVEEKQIIGIIADAPHPDIKALKNAIEAHRNIEVKIYFVNQSQPKPGVFFDLLILYQIPTKKVPFPNWLNRLLDANVPVCSIVGSMTDINKWNKFNGIYNLEITQNSQDNTTPVLAPQFNLFELSQNTKSRINGFTPAKSPFATYKPLQNISTLFTQKILNLETNKPMIIFGEYDGVKKGIFFVQDFWIWRLNEYVEHKNVIAFDEIIQKTVQYLFSKENRKQFNVHPIKEKFQSYEKITFNLEMYNAIFDPLYNQSVKLSLYKNNQLVKNFVFEGTDSGQKLRVTNLSAGVYNYQSSTTINGILFQKKGQFIVSNFDKEKVSIAQHNILRILSQQTKGSFNTFDDFSIWEKDLLEKKSKGRLLTKKSWENILALPWLLGLILFFISVEWVGRKYYGIA